MKIEADVPTRVRFELRRRLAPYPRLFLPLMRRRPAHAGHIVDDHTEVMIEGFPRSGNTFAVAAFQYAQPRPVSIARHLHAPAHVIEGIRRNIPVLVVVRNPVAAVTSMVIRHPGLLPQDGLREYVSFHTRLLPWRDRIEVATFEEVTTHFDDVVRRVNQRFGAEFTPFDHTPENVAEVFRHIEEMENDDRTRRAEQAAHTIARPDIEREALKAGLTTAFQTPPAERLTEKARAVMHALVGEVNTGAAPR